MPRHTRGFWTAAEDWSRRKHLILRYYLTGAAPKLRTQSQDRKVYVFDGYAGRGTYEQGTPGSPIHLAELAAECRTWHSPVALTIYNAEPDAANFAELASSTSQWADQGYVINRRATFQELLPVVLKEADGAPLFAFLDPFRPSHLSFQDIVPLLKRTAATEVCIVFHTPSVIRVLEAVRAESKLKDSVKEKFRTALDEIFGGRVWEQLLQQRPIIPDTVVSCLSEQAANQVSWTGLYICSHGIQARYKVGLKYHIILLTRHPDGVELMNDAFCKEASDVYSQTKSAPDEQLDLDFGSDVTLNDELPVVELTGEQRHRELCASLLEIGTNHPGHVWKRDDLIFASIMSRFGEFSKTEHRQAIAALLERPSNPKIIALDGRRTKAGRWVTNDKTSLKFN